MTRGITGGCYCAVNGRGIECDPAVGPCQQMAVLTGADHARARKLRADLDALGTRTLPNKEPK